MAREQQTAEEEVMELLKNREVDSISYVAEGKLGSRRAMQLRWPPRHILVPLEGEREGKRVIPYATALARTFQAKVTVITVAKPFQWSLKTPSVPAPTTKALETRLIPLVAQMRAAGVDVEFQIRRGNPKKVIGELVDATNVELVILTDRDRRFWPRRRRGRDFVPIMDSIRVPAIVI